MNLYSVVCVEDNTVVSKSMSFLLADDMAARLSALYAAVGRTYKEVNENGMEKSDG